MYKISSKMERSSNIGFKITGVLIVFMFSVLLAGNADGCNISAGEAAATLGATEDISVPLDISPGSGESVAALQVDIDFDGESLLLSNVVIGKVLETAAKQVEFANVGSGKARIVVYGMNQNLISEGTIATLIFRLTDEPIAGRSTLKLNNAVVCDEWAALVPSSTTDGAIMIIAGFFADLAEMKVYPNPYKPSDGHSSVVFMNLPKLDSIKIYTITGELVKEIKEQVGIRANWDGKNDKGSTAASGVYIYLVTTEDGDKDTGRIVVVR